jgi:hypothetical protein
MDDDQNKGSDCGSAYVFVRNGADWIFQAKLLGGDPNEYFGSSVSISGDTALVGCYWDDNESIENGRGSGAGSAYVFVRDGTSWSQQARLLAQDSWTGDKFGYSVSLDGNTALIGAYGNDDNGGSSGSAYIFQRIGVEWEQQAKLLALDGYAGAKFGYSVSLSGDVALIGAPDYYDYAKRQQSGSAYVFVRSGAGWAHEAQLQAADGTLDPDFGFPGDRFGESVSVSGDVALVGDSRDDEKGRDNGGAYVFRRTATFWEQQQKLVAADSETLGSSVSVSGGTALVGAPYQDAGKLTWQYNEGVAYIFPLIPASDVSFAQNIRAFATITPKTFGGAPFAVTAPTSTSGLPVALSIKSGPATSSGYTVTITGVGTVVLAANQAGDVYYTAAEEVTTSFTVSKATPAITTKPVASAITYGQKLSLASLTGGVGSVTGTFAFAFPDAAPNAGTATQSVTFTPTDATNHNSVTTTVSVIVNKATPSISTKPVASAITFGQKLSLANLTGGVASVPGTFAFTTPNATPNAGTTTQSVTFTPIDATNHNSVTTTISVTVNKAAPSITTKPVASAITFGQRLSQATLTGGVASVPGTFAFSNPSLAPKLGKGTQTVLFSPTSANFNSVSFTIEINVVEQKEQKPAITAHPLSQTIADGGRLSLSVQATGGALRYQWTKNGKNITGANLSTFTIAAASASDAGDYRVIVSNSKGSVTSNTARITILAPEIDVQQPAGKSLVTSTSKISFGTGTTKKTSAGIRRTFTIRNTGTTKLTGISFSKRGTHQNDFTVTQSNLREVAPGASATFTVTFKPAAVGQRAASLRIASNDRDENPFIINLAGEGAR